MDGTHRRRCCRVCAAIAGGGHWRSVKVASTAPCRRCWWRRGRERRKGSELVVGDVISLRSPCKLGQHKVYDGASFYRSDFVIQMGTHGMNRPNPEGDLKVNETKSNKIVSNTRGTAAVVVSPLRRAVSVACRGGPFSVACRGGRGVLLFQRLQHELVQQSHRS